MIDKLVTRICRALRRIGVDATVQGLAAQIEDCQQAELRARRDLDVSHRINRSQREWHEGEVDSLRRTIRELRVEAAERKSHRAHIRALQRQLEASKATVTGLREKRRNLEGLAAQLCQERTKLEDQLRAARAGYLNTPRLPELVREIHA